MTVKRTDTVGSRAATPQASLKQAIPKSLDFNPELTRTSSAALISQVLDVNKGSGANGPRQVKEFSNADYERDVRWLNLDPAELSRLSKRLLGGPAGSLVQIWQAGIDVGSGEFCLSGGDLGSAPGIKATRWYKLPANWKPELGPRVEMQHAETSRDEGPGWGRLSNQQRDDVRRWARAHGGRW
ncbi:MAG: hypothetical protein AAB426_08810 [Myxococcota bacterium]